MEFNILYARIFYPPCCLLVSCGQTPFYFYKFPFHTQYICSHTLVGIAEADSTLNYLKMDLWSQHITTGVENRPMIISILQEQIKINVESCACLTDLPDPM